MGKKIEIVDIHLNLDISEEIKKRTDNISEEIKIHTRGIIEKAKMKAQKTKTKKQREKELWAEKCSRALKYMVEAKERGIDLVPGEQLLKIMQAESTSLQSAIQRLKTYLKHGGEWTLERKKSSKQSCYRLERFSDPTP